VDEFDESACQGFAKKKFPKEISEKRRKRQSRIKGNRTKRTELGENCCGILPVDHC
jgi:hypothetical protein